MEGEGPAVAGLSAGGKKVVDVHRSWSAGKRKW